MLETVYTSRDWKGNKAAKHCVCISWYVFPFQLRKGFFFWGLSTSKNNKYTVLILFLMTVTLTAVGCSSAVLESSGDVGQTIRITGPATGDIALFESDIKALDTYSGRVEGADSEGNPVAFDIKGGYLADLLEQNGCTQSHLAGIHITASDGYSVGVPADIVKTRDIIIAYEVNGVPLDADNAPYGWLSPMKGPCTGSGWWTRSR